MKTHSISKSSKKLMAILCAVMMLASCMVFAPTSAAASQGTWDCEANQTLRAWNNTTNNRVTTDHSMTLNTSVEGAHSGTGVVVAKYINNGTEGTDYKKVPAGRLGISGNSECLAKDGYYRVVFWYKIKALPVDAEIQLIVASVNWQGVSLNNTPQVLAAVELKTTDATETWVKADLLFKNSYYTPTMSGLHVVLKSNDNTNCAGTEVWLDDFEYYSLTDSDLITLTLDPNHGSAATATELGIAGMPITTVPTRTGGYLFLGWFDAAEGGNQVTVFPDASTTLYAHWDEPAVTLYTVAFHVNPGKLTGDASLELAAGDVITTSAPVRAGWAFTGWADAEGKAVTTMPANDIDLYAQWTKTGTVPTDARVQDFEDGFDNIQNTTAGREFTLTTEENHTYAGGAAITAHIQNGMNGERTRPRLVLKTNGENFVAEEGKSYVVSFWAKSSVFSGDMRLYLAAYDMDNIADQIVNEEGWGDAHKACHTIQTIAVNGGTEVTQWIGTLPTDWTQYTITIPSFVAHKNPNTEATQSYLVLGITDGGAYTASFGARDFYIDDISVAEVADTGVRDFENEELGSVDVRNADGFKAVVAYGPSHSTVAGKAVKVTQTGGDSGNARVQMVMKDKNGNVIEATAGKRYLVSFWLYAEDTPQTRFWLAPSAGGAGYTNSGEKDKAKIKEQDAHITAAYTWKQVTVLTDAVKEGYEGQLLLGISDARFANMQNVPNNTSIFYVDDISVVEIDSALGKVNGNVGLYKNGENSYYEQDGVKYGALRLLGGYTVADGDATKAVIGGNTYTVKARGILLGKDEQTTLTVDGECYYKSEKTTNLDGYWLMEGNVLKYSLLVNKISADKIDTNVHYRPYIIVTDGTAEYTLYGDTVLNVNWSAVAESAGVDTGWTAE